MNCPKCEYRRIAREAMALLETQSKLLGMIDLRAKRWGLLHAARLREEFRTAYRADALELV